MAKPIEELKEKARLTIKELRAQCHYDYFDVTGMKAIRGALEAQLDKAYGDALAQFCKENNIYQVVEGELPLNPLASTPNLYTKSQQDMLQWHKQSLKPVSSLLPRKTKK